MHSAMNVLKSAAMNVLKSAAIFQSLQPIEIIADGNCLLRTFSKVKYGTECHHGEMRVCLISEAGLNEEKYVNNAHLKASACAEIENANFA